jgi:2,4-dienoyl-CoA reductase (NADPH2)
MYLKQSYMGKQGIRINFVHVVSGATVAAERRWTELKWISNIEKDYPLHFISSSGDVPAALLGVIQSEKYGTIIMGKRGLSGVKRWVLGSVSAGVLRGLTDQTLFLVD